MIIRTQNKKGIVNFNTVDTICVDNNVPVIRYYCGDEITAGTLGTYSTEEKAIEVLDRICDFYFRCEGIFEMPQDSEVEI